MCEPFGPRKLAALKQKFHSIEAEFQDWCERSQLGGLFEKHHSQIRRIQSRLHALCESTRESLRDATDGTALREGRALELEVLAVYRIWEYFRGKLVRARFSRKDGCEIARWNRVVFLFPGASANSR